MILENFLKLHLRKKQGRILYGTLFDIDLKRTIFFLIVVAECYVKVNKLNMMLHFIKFWRLKLFVILFLWNLKTIFF